MPIDAAEFRRQLSALEPFGKWGTKKELKLLPDLLSPGETMRGACSGLWDGNTWLIVATDRRLLFLDKGLIFGLKQVEIPLRSISAVSHKIGLVMGKVEIATGGGSKAIDMIEKADVSRFAAALSDAIASR